MHRVLHQRRGLLDLLKADIHGAGDIDEHAARTVDGGLEQRAGDGHAGGLLGLALACRAAHAHVRHAGVLHDGGDIGKVEVDEAGVADEVGNGLHRLTQHIVRDLKGVGEGDLLIGRMLEALVGDNDEGIDLALQLLDALFGLLHPAAALKAERLGDDADGQDALLAGDLGHDGRAARAGAAAHAGGDEHHVGILQRLGDLGAALLRALAAHLGIAARALAVGQLLADLDLIGSAGNVERLLIGIDRDEIHAAGPGAHHAVDHVIAAAADADDLDPDDVFNAGIQSECHIGSSYYLL